MKKHYPVVLQKYEDKPAPKIAKQSLNSKKEDTKSISHWGVATKTSKTVVITSKHRKMAVKEAWVWGDVW